MQNSMAVFTFFVFDQKYPFCANLFQKFKIISLSRNLISRLIGICRVSGDVLFFCVHPETHSWGKFGSKCQNY